MFSVFLAEKKKKKKKNMTADHESKSQYFESIKFQKIKKKGVLGFFVTNMKVSRLDVTRYQNFAGSTRKHIGSRNQNNNFI